MKKLFFIAVFTVFGLSSINAQDFKVGANVGLPIGDSDEGYTLNIGVDVSYLWEVSDMFNAGVIAGYSHFLGESIDVFGLSIDNEDAGFVPVAGAARFNVSDKFTVGADLGYAVGISPDGNDGGFYYAPKGSIWCY